MDESVKKIPKAELHVHIEGTLTPDMARKLAKRHGMTLDSDIFNDDGTEYVWKDFADCVTRVYNAAASTVRTREDYKEITYDYLKRCADEGCIYVEMIVSPDHCEEVGVSYTEMLDGMSEAIDMARADCGIEARMNAVLIRHLPIEEVEKTADIIVNNRHPYVVGINLAGAEIEGDVPKFAPILDDIDMRTNGEMGSSPHAGEAAGPRNLWDCLGLRKLPKRIGHGVRSIEDSSLIKQLIDKDIALEVCPTSNILAGIYPSFKDHPLRQLKDAGVKITLNSDDPGLFGNSVGAEYQIAKDEFGFTDQELLETTRNAIEASFVDDLTRKSLIKKLDSFTSAAPSYGQNHNPPKM
jgi:adenosine deaminase